MCGKMIKLWWNVAKVSRQQRERGNRKLEEKFEAAEDPYHPTYGTGTHWVAKCEEQRTVFLLVIFSET